MFDGGSQVRSYYFCGWVRWHMKTDCYIVCSTGELCKVNREGYPYTITLWKYLVYLDTNNRLQQLYNYEVVTVEDRGLVY